MWGSEVNFVEVILSCLLHMSWESQLAGLNYKHLHTLARNYIFLDWCVDFASKGKDPELLVWWGILFSYQDQFCALMVVSRGF